MGDIWELQNVREHFRVCLQGGGSVGCATPKGECDCTEHSSDTLYTDKLENGLGLFFLQAK